MMTEHARTVVIGNAKIVEGAGNPRFGGDVAISENRIAAVAPAGRIDPRAADVVVDARRLVVCPGFIDIQSHSIIPFLTDWRSLSKVTQGVATGILGEDWTPAGVRRAVREERGISPAVPSHLATGRSGQGRP